MMEQKISKDDFIAKGATTSHVMNKYGEYGILVVFSPENIISKDFAHEAFHVANFIADICGLDYVKDTGNEHIAYLIGYVISLFEDWKNKTFKKINKMKEFKTTEELIKENNKFSICSWNTI